ncbi:RING finger protein 17 [Tiliqua scincoides]|uniref:RING finger protein 17 n=1 Tax=Tiliqua scincoides TaxID=71010 RepID=UPI0034633D93
MASAAGTLRHRRSRPHWGSGFEEGRRHGAPVRRPPADASSGDSGEWRGDQRGRREPHVSRRLHATARSSLCPPAGGSPAERRAGSVLGTVGWPWLLRGFLPWKCLGPPTPPSARRSEGRAVPSTCRASGAETPGPKLRSWYACSGVGPSPRYRYSEVRPIMLIGAYTQDNQTLQEIENALEVAKSNLESLKMTEEILGHLVTEIKQEEENIADVINKKFEDIAASLNSRKRKLQAELETNTWNYITDVRKVQVCVTQKRRNLDAAIKMARELKAKHSLKTCYNLSQVLSNLRITIEDEVLKVDNLKKRTLPRFYMECEEITSVHENIGKFSLDLPNVSHFGDCPLQTSSVEDKFKPASPRMCRKHKQFVGGIDSVVLGQESECLQGNDTQCQEMNLLFTQKCNAGVLWADSTPDVIIEEIIEDNQEKYSEETCQKKGVKKRLAPFGPKADSLQLVFVSCVINPSHFYVQTLLQKKTAVYLEKTLRQFCRSKNSSPGDVLELGTIVFVRSKEHGIWCRAQIIELIPVQNVNEGKPCGPTKYRICDIAKMQVFLIDFGHSEVLVVSGVADDVKANPEPISLEYVVTKDLCLVVKKPDLHIEAQLRGINKLALQCSLKDIVPKHSVSKNLSWNGAARTEFLRMINNKAVLMKVFREENGVLIVDLMKPPANKISSDMPVSLRDALVFLDLASFCTELPCQSESTVPLQYCPPVMPQENTEVSVVVSYINSPGDFYLQLLEQGPEFAVFLKKVKEVYSNEGGDNLEIVYPIQGQPCIARFEDDGEWYRAQVIGLLDHQEVEVKYVDFGNISKINVKDMRKIKDDFLASPAKAIRCKLAYIEPCKGSEEWSSESKDRFEELTRDKCMFCFVAEKSQDNILTVELYESGHALPDQSWSVNSLLVKEDLASYVISNPKSTDIPHCEVWDPTLEETFRTEGDVLKPGNVDLSQIDLKLECNKELQVRISHVVSPSKIFVQLLSSEKYLQSIQEKMTATCYESENETIQWKIDMNCAAYVQDLNEWRRGQIHRIVSENNMEVFLLDYGEIKTMNTVSLRKLDEDLNTVRPLAVECSLADIRPAGGTDEWTATACDRLVQYLTGTIVNIIVQESNSSPLPVKIFSKDGGVNTDISEQIIEEGLAFRRRPWKTDLNTQTPPENPYGMNFQQENVDISNSSVEIEGIPGSPVPEEKPDICITEREEQALNFVAHQRMAESYKPPVVPGTDHFSATVSCVADNGTIYVIPKSQEPILNKLMNDMQNNFKCLGLLKPYCWKKGEACVVRAADTMWYRGQVIEIGGGIIKVQYIDYGYIEKIPQCHLYPTVLYADIPPFSIPCQLYKTVPVGSIWQQDAVELFQELLTKRPVEIHIMEQLDDPSGKVSVKLYFSGISLSSFMAWHKHCISEEDDGNIPTLDLVNYSDDRLEENCEITYEELMLSEADTPLLPPYILPTLPVLGALFPVKVTHIVLPNKVYIAFDQSDNPSQDDDIGVSGMRWNSDSEALDEALNECNENIQSYCPLTDFRTGMPCLAQYIDGLWYRGKLLSILEFNPLTILVEFVDYGGSEKLTTDRLRQIPSHLMQYPVQAFKVLLAGFKPALCDSRADRIPYCPEWSLDALWAMMECLQGKRLSASSLMHSPEHTVFLYGDGHLVHMELVEMGFAELN